MTPTLRLLPLLLVPMALAAALAQNAPRPAPKLPAASTPAAATFRNPLKQDGADPWMGYHEGYYYLATTSAVDVKLRRARRIADLKAAPDQVVWKDDTPTRSRNIWASEFFLLESGRGPRWYLYYTADDGQNGDRNHRMYVAESAGTDPMGPYTFKAQIETDEDNAHYSIDGTVLKMDDGQLYFLWCGRPSPNGQGLYISRMTNPWTTVGGRTYLPASGFGCDVVREGPMTLQRNGRVFLTYSACPADTPDYKIGMLIADEKADLTKAESWQQHPNILFGRVDQRGVFGPGHHTFFKSPDGKEDWIVYHAKPGTKVTYGDRSTRAQKIGWTPEGLPDLGLPLAVETDVPVPSGEAR